MSNTVNPIETPPGEDHADAGACGDTLKRFYSEHRSLDQMNAFLQMWLSLQTSDNARLCGALLALPEDQRLQIFDDVIQRATGEPLRALLQ